MQDNVKAKQAQKPVYAYQNLKNPERIIQNCTARVLAAAEAISISLETFEQDRSDQNMNDVLFACDLLRERLHKLEGIKLLFNQDNEGERL